MERDNQQEWGLFHKLDITVFLKKRREMLDNLKVTNEIGIKLQELQNHLNFEILHGALQ